MMMDKSLLYKRNARFALEELVLVGIVVNMSRNAMTTCHLLPISGRHGWYANLVTEWVAGVTCHKLLCVVYDTTRWRSLSTVSVACCDMTKKDVDMMSHLSCQQHVTKCHMSLTLSQSILLLQQMTIPTKELVVGSSLEFVLKKMLKMSHFDHLLMSPWFSSLNRVNVKGSQTSTWMSWRKTVWPNGRCKQWTGWRFLLNFVIFKAFQSIQCFFT